MNENHIGLFKDVVINNEPKILEFFLEKFDINDFFIDLLVYSIKNEKLNSLKCLMDKNTTKIEKKNIDKFFQKALKIGSVKIINYLLHQFDFPEELYNKKKSFNLEMKNKKDLTLLQISIKYGFLKLVKLLINLGANFMVKSKKRGNLLQMASYYNKPKIIDYLIREKNFEINEKDEKRGNSAFLKSVNLGNFESVKKLIELGTDINLVNFEGIGALTMSMFLEKKKIFKFLLDLKNLEINLENMKGEIPLFYCSILEDMEIFGLLLSKGANIHKIDNNGNNILNFHLIDKKTISEEWIEFLRKLKVDPSLKNKNRVSFKDRYERIEN